MLIAYTIRTQGAWYTGNRID